MGKNYKPRAFQVNGPEYFWQRGPKMEISWNKLVILDMCKESQCGWNTVNRVENANMESFNNRGQIL